MTNNNNRKNKDSIKMTHTYVSLCATCEYWLGERALTTNGSGKQVVKTNGESAACRNKKSKFNCADRKNNNKCIEHKYWSKIED